MKCKYWVRNNREKDLSELVHEKKPDGTFYAKEITAQTYQDNEIGNMFMFDQNSVTVFTLDSVDIKENDVVEYSGNYWNVNNVQRVSIKKQTEFLERTDNRTYIQLRK